MINELYQLTAAFDQAGIETENIHPKYKPIPKVTKKAPCLHIILDHGKIYKAARIEQERAVEIKKYGSNQGTFPAMNLAPLYRLTDETEKKKISDLVEGTCYDFDIEEMKYLCREDNWGKKLRNKYRICMQEVPREVRNLLQKNETLCEPLQQFFAEVNAFENAAYLHEELERVSFEILERKKDISLAFKILFQLGNSEKGMEQDAGTLSVVLDSKGLRNAGLSVATADFTSFLNKKLLAADTSTEPEVPAQEMDAFGILFTPFEEPMPTVKLAAGFEVSLRTMFRGQPCQSRYGRIGNATYPFSKDNCFKMQSVLSWMGAEENKEITWINTDKDEALFAYAELMRENNQSLTGFMDQPVTKTEPDDGEVTDKAMRTAEFEAEVKAFIREFRETKAPDTDPRSERIQYFILRKIDKARTKVVYTYNASAAEIERCSEQWTQGCQNLPQFTFKKPLTLFPLRASNILNRIWRQDGRPAADKFKPIPRYHGLQILFGVGKAAVRRDLFIIVSNITNLAPYLGKIGLARGRFEAAHKVLLSQTQNTLALMGLLLYQLEIGKEQYMQEFPYLLGQILKLSDELHEMYGRVVRGNDVPNTLAGSGLYTAGAEQPFKTLAVLGQRMNPYITWAKSYRTKGIQKEGEESWRAGWYLSVYEDLAGQLRTAWGKQSRFNEVERAQYFIGYLAKFPKKEKTENDKGGTENE